MKPDEIPDEWVRQLAASLDHPSVFMGGPSERNQKRAREALAAVIPLAVAAEREACAKEAAAVTGAGRTLCPYGNDRPGDPTWNHTDEDICPVCRKNGHESRPYCTNSVGGAIAAAIRARPTT